MKKIPIYKFYRHKYGSELLIDVLEFDELKEGIRRAPIHRETFYQIVLFTKGHEPVGVNNYQRVVNPGEIVCARPGEVWRWRQDTALEGYVLIFEGAFLLSFFNDASFLEHFHYLKPERSTPFLFPDTSLEERLLHLFRQMKEEMENPQNKDQHILRAMLYEFLMLLNRAGSGSQERLLLSTPSSDRYHERFVRLADRDYREHHDVEYYANKLCITSNYLSRLVCRHTGITTKQYLNKKLIDESKRLLVYTTLSVNEISDWLCFDSAAYFIRLFHKSTGVSPTQYRKIHSEKD